MATCSPSVIAVMLSLTLVCISSGYCYRPAARTEKWSAPIINMVSICSSCLGNCCIAENFNVGAVEGKNGGEVMTYTYDLASRLVPATTWQAQVFTYTNNAVNKVTSAAPGNVLGGNRYSRDPRSIR